MTQWSSQHPVVPQLGNPQSSRRVKIRSTCSWGFERNEPGQVARLVSVNHPACHHRRFHQGTHRNQPVNTWVSGTTTRCFSPPSSLKSIDKKFKEENKISYQFDEHDYAERLRDHLQNPGGAVLWEYWCKMLQRCPSCWLEAECLPVREQYPPALSYPFAATLPRFWHQRCGFATQQASPRFPGHQLGTLQFNSGLTNGTNCLTGDSIRSRGLRVLSHKTAPRRLQKPVARSHCYLCFGPTDWL